MTDPYKIRLLVVDDHDMLREGLAAFLRAFPDLDLIGEAGGGEEAIQQCRDLQPDVVLMDLIMPEVDGVTAIGIIHQEMPDIKIVALSSFGEDKLVRDALQAGATSYMLKNVSANNLAEAIRATYAGLPTLAPEVTRSLLNQPTTQTITSITAVLTQREQEVLNLMADGLSNAEIGQRLNISIFTVKNHVSSILSKLNVNSRTEAVSLALKEQ